MSEVSVRLRVMKLDLAPEYYGCPRAFLLGAGVDNWFEEVTLLGAGNFVTSLRITKTYTFTFEPCGIDANCIVKKVEGQHHAGFPIEIGVIREGGHDWCYVKGDVLVKLLKPGQSYKMTVREGP